jgi:hypothetical protein
MLFKCLVEMGHQGAGHSMEKILYYTVNSAVEAYSKALRAPGTKKGAGARVSVKPVSK